MDVTTPGVILEEDVIGLWPRIVIFLYLIITLVLLLALLIGYILEILCFIMFTYHFIKKTPKFCTGFFYILTLGYIFGGIDATSMLLFWIFPGSTFLRASSALAQWYCGFIIGPWNTFMALYRFSAIFFWSRHKYCWTKWPIVAILTFIVVYPFLISGYLLFADFECLSTSTFKTLNDYSDSCITSERLKKALEWISNSINILICIALGVLTSLATRRKWVRLSEAGKKFERALFIQTIVTTVIFGTSCGLIFFGSKYLNGEARIHDFSSFAIIYSSAVFFIIYYGFFYLGATVLLFFIS